MDAIVKDLAALIGTENVLADHASRQVYAAAALFARPAAAQILPLACAMPRNYGQMEQLLAYCAKNAIHLIFRGGATGFAHPPLPLVQDTLVILTTGLNRIYEIDKGSRLAHVQPGVTVAQLAKAAGKAGLCYPPMPYAAEVATIGGNLALNAAGANFGKYGPAANYLLELEIWTTSGQKLSCASAAACLGQLMPALPLAQLFCGSAGCLGLIGDCRLRLLPLKTRTVLAILCQGQGQALDLAAKALALEPDFVDIFDPACTAIVLGHASSWSVVLAVEAERLAKARAVWEASVELPEDTFFNQRKQLLPALRLKGSFQLETFCCPPQRCAALLAGLEEIAAKRGLRLAMFVHAGLARVYAALYETGDQAEITTAITEMAALELLLNDAMTAAEEITQSRRQWQKAHRAPVSALSQELQKLLDPGGLLQAVPLPGESK